MFYFSGPQIETHSLSSRDSRLLKVLSGYAGLQAARVTGRPVTNARTFCYRKLHGRSTPPALYDPTSRSIGIHQFVLENTTKFLNAEEKDVLEQRLIVQRPIEEFLKTDTTRDIIGALVHEYAHYLFDTALMDAVYSALRKKDSGIHGKDDLRIDSINEGFAFAVQGRATGLISLCETITGHYLNANILAQYYLELRDAECDLADALLDTIRRIGFTDFKDIILISKDAAVVENERRLWPSK